MKRRRNVLLNFILILLLIIAACTGYQIFDSHQKYQDGENYYEKLKEDVAVVKHEVINEKDEIVSYIKK